MKILFYTDSDYFSGAERVLAEVVAGLKNIDSLLVVNPKIAARFKAKVGAAVPVLPLASRAKANFFLLLKFRKLLKEHRPDRCVVNMQTPFANTYFLLSAAQLKIPVATVWHLPQERHEITGLLSPLKLLAYQLAIKWSQKIVTVSHWHQGVLVKQFHAPQEKVLTIPNGVVEPPSITKPSHHPRVMVAIGTLEQRKGQLLLLNALKKVKEPYKLLIIGGGPDEAALRTLAAAPELSGKISVEGYQTNVGQYYDQADILVHPALAENLSMVILDALAHQLPVVAHAVGGNGEMVVPGENGWLVSPGDTAGWVKAITEALSTDLTSRRQGSYERFQKYYRLEQMIKSYQQFLEGWQ